MERIKINLPEMFSFSAKLKIRITDINYGGHVGNDVFLSLIHEARQQFLNYYGYSELLFEGVALIMIDAAIEFKKELVFKDEISISVAAANFIKNGFDIFYKLELLSEKETTLAGKAKTGMLCFNYEQKKIVALPEVARQKLCAE